MFLSPFPPATRKEPTGIYVGSPVVMLRRIYKAAESFDAAFSSPSCASSDYFQRIITIDGNPVRLGKVIAEGGFSFVHSAEFVSGASSRPIAVKRLSVTDHDALARARAEADLLTRLPRHRNVVCFLGSLFTEQDGFLAFEMLDGGSLAEVLDRRRSKPLSSEEALKIFYDVAAAVVHLHSQNPAIACRDLKVSLY